MATIFTDWGDHSIYHRRVAEMYGVPMSGVLDDFSNTGVIRGGPKYGGDAFFLKGAYWDPSKQWTGSGKELTSTSDWYAGAPRSLQISVDPAKLDAYNNPLYLKNENNLRFGNPENYPFTLNSLKNHADYPLLQADKDASLLSKINPLNRSGIKIQGNTGEIYYDRLTPFSERPLTTHFNNLETEASILGRSISPYISNIAKVAGPTLFSVDAYNRKQEGMSRGEDPKVYGSTYSTDAIANAASLGTWDFIKWYSTASEKERQQHWNTVGQRFNDNGETKSFTY